jgi:two-component system NtrC family sensor kinase
MQSHTLASTMGPIPSSSLRSARVTVPQVMSGERLPTVAGAFLRSLVGSLGITLFVSLFALIVAAFGAYAILSVRTTSRQWDESTRAWAGRVQQIIVQSTHHAMLQNRRDDIDQIVRTVARTPGVEAVRVYDHRGMTAFSSNPGDVGGGIDMAALRRGSEGIVEVLPQRVLRVVSPIGNGPECWSAPCHVHPPSRAILGALEVSLSLREPDARLAETRRQIVWAGILVALVVALSAALLIQRVVTRPVRALTARAQEIAAGEFGTEIPVASHQELGELARAFNAMSVDLRRAHDALTGWSTKLEERLQEKIAELGSTQRQVAHMDKMASLGRLAATVAHELNNPLAGILTYARLVQRMVHEGGEAVPHRGELERCLGLIQKEATRSGAIVRNLLTFARRSGAELSASPLNPVLERSALLVSHHAKMAGVGLTLDLLDGDDTVVCDPDQLEQALVALLVNAIEATPAGGTLRLAGAPAPGEQVTLTVSDTGTGIPDDVLPHIFEPFFTSKEDGSVGLGLSVVYGIVQRHGGAIDVDSAPGRGTTFRITLPRGPRGAPTAVLPPPERAHA